MTVTQDTDKNTKKKSRFQVMFTRFENSYKEFLKKAIERKYLVFGSTVVLLILSVYGTQFINSDLVPETEADEISINFYLADGMNIAVANHFLEELVIRVESIVLEVHILFLFI